VVVKDSWLLLSLRYLARTTTSFMLGLQIARCIMVGWISLHRKLLENPIFKNYKLLQVFLYCLLKASHKEHDLMIGDSIVKLKTGQLATGRKAISLATGLTEQNVRTSLAKLEKLGILTIKPTNKYSIISITNWDQHQQSNQQVTSSQPASNQQVTTNNNVNNENKKIPYQFIVDIYHEYCPALPKVVKITDKRKTQIKKLWNDDERHQGGDFWRWYFSSVKHNPHWMGENDRAWTADLDFLINHNQFYKVIERAKKHGL